MSDLYQDQLLDLARNPLHQGQLSEPDQIIHGRNASCGDEVSISIKFSSDRQSIEALQWEGQGCVISQAAMSLVADWAQGLPISELKNLTYEALTAELGLEDLSPGRVKCVLLGLQTLLDKLSTPEL